MNIIFRTNLDKYKGCKWPRMEGIIPQKGDYIQPGNTDLHPLEVQQIIYIANDVGDLTVAIEVHIPTSYIAKQSTEALKIFY